MPVIARETQGKEFKRVPAGAHFAICNMVVDVGLQEGFNGKPQHKVYLRFEVPDERVEYEKDGQSIEGPCSIGRFYTLSLSEKANLRKDLENWRGKTFTRDELQGFDLANVLGKPCQVMVTHEESNGKTYANITGIMGVSRDQKQRANQTKPENEPVVFSVSDWNQRAFDSLPEWLRKKIEERKREPDVQPNPQFKSDSTDFDDDIPFAWAALIPLSGLVAYLGYAAQTMLQV